MDFPFGQDAIVPLRVTSRFTGAPVVTGVTVAATAVYGPGSTTSLVTPAAAIDRGGGVWTVAVPMANLTVAGEYTLAYNVTAPAEATVTSATTTFRVGNLVPGAWTMRDLLVSIIRSLGGSVRPSTLINLAQVTDPFWVGLGATQFTQEEFSGSEIILIDPSGAATYADWPVARVTYFDGTQGMFILNISTGLVSDVSRRQYALFNVSGAGFMFESILEELRVSHDEIGPTSLASVSVGLTVNPNALEYVLPAHLTSVLSVSVGSASNNPTDTWDDIGGRWEVLPDRRLLRLDGGLGVGSEHVLRVTGGVRCELPKLGGSYTDLRGAYLRERVRFGILSSSPNPNHQRAASAIYANLARQPSPYRRVMAGEVKLS